MSTPHVFKGFKHYLETLVPKPLPLKSKILKYTCLIILFFCIIGISVNFALGFPIQINLVIALFALIVSGLFVKMPLYSHHNLTSFILIFMSLITLSINWFPNGGLHTSSPFLFLLLIGFAAVTMTGGFLWFTVTLCMLVLANLSLTEYFFPQWLPILHPTSTQVKLDIIINLVGLSYLLAWFISTILKTNQKRYEQVEEASQAKSLFLSQLSHELRTPLNAVIGFSNLMLKQQDLPDTQKQYLKSINTNGFHLLALVNQVMDLSMIEAGKLELHWQEVNLVKLLQDIEDVMGIEAAKKALHYATRIEVDENFSHLLNIQSDPNRLRQILINLINNALKYTDTGSVTCRLSNDAHQLSFEIEDTGSGIPEDKQEEIFEPLFRLEKHHQKEGKGIGLSITRSLCKHLGYRLELISSSAAGSCFRLTIPATDHP